MNTAAGFDSILFDRAGTAGESPAEEPDFFGDIHLDQIVAAATAGHEEYDLKPLFYTPVADVATIQYRHDVVRDLQQAPVRELVLEFAGRMRRVRGNLAQADKLRYRLQQQRWFLDAVDVYCGALTALDNELTRVEISSRGLTGFREYVSAYLAGERFRSLAGATRELREQLATVKYCVHIRAPRVIVRGYEGEADYGNDVEKTFARFKQGAVEDYRVTFPEYAQMNHVEAQVLDRVAALHPDIFGEL